MEVLLRKTPQGSLIPANDDEAEKLRKVKSGATVRTKITQMRNERFFRKWWTLVSVGFDIWAETAPPREYKGEAVLPDRERFRKDITILAGHHHAVFNVKGEMRLEADSIAWGSMDEESFEQLYQKTITVILNKVLASSGMTEERLNQWVDRVMEYA